MRKISAVIISRNEERHIARCLSSLTWADEIVVVDAESTDRTPEISKDPKAVWAPKLKWITKPWAGFREQRNYSLAAASNDWILVVDADESCSPELAKRVREILDQPEEPTVRAWKVKRVEYFLGKPILYGIWNPSYQDRFFHRKGIQYINDIHEYPSYPPEPGRIHAPLLHAEGFSPDKFLDKMNRYTSIEAMDRVKQGQRTNWFRLLTAFPAMFWKNYFYYKAYRDGMHGFVISLLEGVSRVVRHIKIWQYSRRDLT